VVLEGVEQAHHPLPPAGEHVALGLEVCLLVLPEHLGLPQALDGHQAATLLLPAEPHLPEGPAADDRQGLEVAPVDFFPPPAQLLALLVLDVAFCLVLLLDG
jgi:hypothetical protein